MLNTDCVTRNICKLRATLLLIYFIDKQIMKKIDCNLLLYLIEAKKTRDGKTYYLVHVGDKCYRFSLMDSVLDFVGHNDLGFVQI